MDTKWQIKPPIWEDVFKATRLVSPSDYYTIFRSSVDGKWCVSKSKTAEQVRFTFREDAIKEAESCYENDIRNLVKLWMERV